MKVSCVCCTYGRFKSLGRSLSCWLYQDYADKELIIYNTAPVDLQLHPILSSLGIRVINRSIDEDGKSYTSLGKIREEALAYADGDVYICWDDDDLFLPWHISQGMTYLVGGGWRAWGPERSYFSTDGGIKYQLVENNLEASILVYISEVRRLGFAYESGTEHLPWLDGLRSRPDVLRKSSVTPFESYAYVWGDRVAPHKTSGRVNDNGNFENHKMASTDFGSGQLLRHWHKSRIDDFYWKNIMRCFPDDALRKKFLQYINKDFPEILVQE